MDNISTEAILESISDGVFTVDHSWHITSFNRAAEEITGISREQAIGLRCSEVFKSNMCERQCPLARTFETGNPCGVFARRLHHGKRQGHPDIESREQ